ncbi:MAG: hypothetical protein K6E47_07405 [Lachnospiraceae bacterium]|nr:hypothetical protein [Lachnospiraceae bacterium]
MKGKKHLLRGSFTVEASFVVPIIIFGIVALIWCVFYLRNSVKVMADTDYFMFVLEADAAKNRNEGVYEKRITGDTPEDFYGAKSAGGYIRRDGRDIDIEVEMEHNLPEEGILGYFVSGIRTISMEKQEKIPDPSEISRIIKAAGELMEQLKVTRKKNKDG